MKVLVIGAGFAGVAAALAARRAGASVTVVHHVSGASELYSGAVDGDLEGPGPLLDELGRALGLQLGAGTIVATREGVVRPARGRDVALLDLAPLAGKRIGVVDVPRDDWDGPLLVRAYRESRWARATGTSFELVPLELLEKGHQRRTSPYDFAAGFERAERPAWLTAVLKAHAGPDAWLFGPWLGSKRALASELTSSVGVPVGEVTSPPGGAAGARFEARRDALLASLGAEVVRSRVRAARADGTQVVVELDEGPSITADALVLAAGGFVSGGLELSGALSGAVPAGFRLAIDGLPPVTISGEVATISSLFGVDLATRGRRVLERVGVPIAADGRLSGAPRVLGAGDVLGSEPPSVGLALTTGLRAGAAAAVSR